jgi:hypothetical protein
VPEDDVAEGQDSAGNVREFVALPERTEDATQSFRRCLADLIRLLGINVAPGPDARAEWEWERRVRATMRTVFAERSSLPEESFDALLKAAVHDPNPSFNRQFVEPALNAFGRRRVQLTLLDYLQTGTDQERAGSARAWYWTGLPLRLQHLRAAIPAKGSGEKVDGVADVVAAWREAALREFVRNEHLDVRRCLLPGLPLYPAAYPPELHPLIDTAVAIARSHPDDYLRHRVEHQVRS